MITYICSQVLPKTLCFKIVKDFEKISMYQYNYQNNQLFEEEQQMTILNPAIITSKSHQLKSIVMKWKCFGAIGIVFTLLFLLVFCSISPNPLTASSKTSKISNPSTTTPKTVQCETVCTSDLFPICGSDGITYKNHCLFKVATCFNPKMKLRNHGPCYDEIFYDATTLPSKITPTTLPDEDYISGK